MYLDSVTRTSSESFPRDSDNTGRVYVFDSIKRTDSSESLPRESIYTAPVVGVRVNKKKRFIRVTHSGQQTYRRILNNNTEWMVHSTKFVLSIFFEKAIF